MEIRKIIREVLSEIDKGISIISGFPSRVYKNPSLEEAAMVENGARGVIFPNGDLFLLQKDISTNHYQICGSLNRYGYIRKPNGDWFDQFVNGGIIPVHLKDRKIYLANSVRIGMWVDVGFTSEQYKQIKNNYNSKNIIPFQDAYTDGFYQDDINDFISGKLDKKN